MKERLSHIKGRIGNQQVAVYYIWYNPKATLTYETEDATEDMLWLVAEIEKLRIENHDLRSPRYSAVLKQLELEKEKTKDPRAMKKKGKEEKRNLSG